MDRSMLSVVGQIINRYGDDILENMFRTNAVLLDLTPDMARERVLVRDLVEVDGYRLLKSAGGEYPIIKRRLIQQLTDMYCMERTAAEWVVRLFGAALGYEDGAALGVLTISDGVLREPAPVAPMDVNALVAIGKAHTVAVAADGTLFANGLNDHFQCDVSTWRGVVAIAAGDEHTVGLKSDGTVLAAGRNTYDQCDVGHLTGVASVYAFKNNTVCIKTDGTAVTTGLSDLDLSSYTNIKTVAWFPDGVFIIKGDGTVEAALRNTEDDEASLQWAQSLRDVVQIIATYTMGNVALKHDGHIYKMNEADNYYTQWRDVVSIVDLSDYFAILRADGTVRVLSYDRDRPRKVTEADGWKDIIAIYGKYKRLIGLTRDGHLRAVCTDPDWLRRNGSLDYVKAWYPVGLPSY